MPPPGRGGGHAARGRGRGRGSRLDGFARGKQSTYDPIARKEKERALNAKTVNKYRKLQKRLAASGEHEAVHPHEVSTVLVGGVGESSPSGAPLTKMLDAHTSQRHGRPRAPDDGEEGGEDVSEAAVKLATKGRKQRGSQLLRLAEKARGPQAAAQGRAPQSRQGSQHRGGSRYGNRGAQDGGTQQLRDDILHANWTVSTPDPENPEKKLESDALEVLDSTRFTNALNKDALPLLRHLVPERDWRRFASGDLSPEEQEKLIDRLSFVLYRSPQGDARQLRRHTDMMANPDFRISDSLGTTPSTDPTQPLPSALDVLTEQRDYFLQELGVSEEEYESIKADVAADFDATVRPLLEKRTESGEAQAEALESMAEASVPEDHVHAAAIKDKLGVLERNAFWPQASKLTFAQRLVKALS